MNITEWEKGDKIVVDTGNAFERSRVLGRIVGAHTGRTGKILAPRSGWTLWQLMQLSDDISIPITLDPLLTPWTMSGYRKPLYTRTPPWEHQREGCEFAYMRAGTLFGIPMGGGKSKMAVDMVANWAAKRVLIVAPLAALGVWPKQFRIHSEEEFVCCNPTKGTVKKRAEEAAKTLHARFRANGRGALIVNHQSVWREPFADLIKELKFDVLIVDECHRAKAHSGRLSRFLQAVRGGFPHRLGLSGTPFGQHDPDIFAQARFLDPGFFGDGWTKFSQRYVAFGGPQGNWPQGLKPEAREEFVHLCSQFLFLKTQAEIDEAADLPEMLPPQYIEAPLPQKLMQEYLRLKEEFVAFLNEGEVTADNVLVKLLRLAQLCSGHVRTDDDRVVTVSTHKADALRDHLEDCPRPTVVVCRFTADLGAVQAAAEGLRLRYHEVSGRRKELTGDSTIRPDTEVLGVQVQSGSEAIDLSDAHHMVVMSIGYSLVNWLQMRKRLHRMGQKHKVSTTHIVAPDTIDTDIRQGLEANMAEKEFVSKLVQEAGVVK